MRRVIDSATMLLPHNSSCSLVVRRHQSFDMAHAYLIGLKDGDQSERYDTTARVIRSLSALLAHRCPVGRFREPIINF